MNATPPAASATPASAATPPAATSEVALDLRGLSCPLPVLRANRVLRGMAPGSRLRVLASDRASIADFQSFCRETGHALVAFSEDAGSLSFVIRRCAQTPPS